MVYLSKSTMQPWKCLSHTSVNGIRNYLGYNTVRKVIEYNSIYTIWSYLSQEDNI